MLICIDDLFSYNQNAFLKGWQINNCNILAHVLIKGFNKPRVYMKVDLWKAFDIVNRDWSIMFCIAWYSPTLGLNGSDNVFLH